MPEQHTYSDGNLPPKETQRIALRGSAIEPQTARDRSTLIEVAQLLHHFSTGSPDTQKKLSPQQLTFIEKKYETYVTRADDLKSRANALLNRYGTKPQFLKQIESVKILGPDFCEAVLATIDQPKYGKTTNVPELARITYLNQHNFRVGLLINQQILQK